MVHLNEQAHEKLKDMWYNIVLKDDYSDVGKEGNISTSIGGEEEINVEKGLEIFGQEGREAQEFLDSIESLLDQGEDILIEKQFDGGYSYDNRVEDLQTSLVLLGYELPIYGIDGLFGPETEMSVMEFQEDGGLTNDGIIDYETIERIILNLSEYSDEDINDFLKTSVGRGLNKYYDFGSYTEKVSPSKLLSDLNSELNNDNLSKALVANAVGESSLNVGIAGDSGKYAMKSERNRRRNVGGFCSFGLWQYNICGGLGVTLLDYYGVDVDDASPDEKMEVLSDYDKQVSFMINHVKRKGVVSQDKSVGEWIEWVVRKIEIPKDKESAIKKRIEHASRLGYLS
jgi:peptidoglycan hydrolase-like protein with peptidoglycan-binding domain